MVPKLKTRKQLKGFSILELLVVISVIIILIALSLPSITVIRNQAMSASVLSQLRSNQLVLSMYTADHRGYWPNFAEAIPEMTFVDDPNGGILIDYFGMHHTWNYVLADSYYSTHPRDPIFISPAYDEIYPEGEVFFTSFYMSCSLTASPEYWNETTRTGDRTQWKGMREDQVLLPSSKISLLDSWWHPDRADLISPDRLIRFATTDGSVAAYPLSSFRRGYRRGDGDISLTQGGHVGDVPRGGMHTLDGIHGRDTNR